MNHEKSNKVLTCTRSKPPDLFAIESSQLESKQVFFRTKWTILPNFFSNPNLFLCRSMCPSTMGWHPSWAGRWSSWVTQPSQILLVDYTYKYENSTVAHTSISKNLHLSFFFFSFSFSILQCGSKYDVITRFLMSVIPVRL